MAGRPLPRVHRQYDDKYLRRLVADIEARLTRLEQTAHIGWLDPTNLVVKRDLDADGTLADGLDVLGTLIQDLKAKGNISK